MTRIHFLYQLEIKSWRFRIRGRSGNISRINHQNGSNHGFWGTIDYVFFEKKKTHSAVLCHKPIGPIFWVYLPIFGLQ